MRASVPTLAMSLTRAVRSLAVGFVATVVVAWSSALRPASSSMTYRHLGSESHDRWPCWEVWLGASVGGRRLDSWAHGGRFIVAPGERAADHSPLPSWGQWARPGTCRDFDTFRTKIVDRRGWPLLALEARWQESVAWCARANGSFSECRDERWRGGILVQETMGVLVDGAAGEIVRCRIGQRDVDSMALRVDLDICHVVFLGQVGLAATGTRC